MQNLYAVYELTTYLRELFESDALLSDIWVAGEVANLSRPPSGHAYFTLKDARAQLRCAFFARRGASGSATGRLLQDGHAVVAHGRIAFYEQRGDLQFVVDFVQPEGVGALRMEFERLKAKLQQEGLFDEGRKRPLPRYPQRVGVITSPAGAVFHDICQVLERRWPVAEVVLAPTPVQGPEAASGIVGAIGTLNGADGIDVIIAARGGGDEKDLWPFNEEPVARAIFGSRLPVVSGVGHEPDTTIADFVADRRAPTPSAAAEIVAPDRRDVAVRLAVAAGAMASTVSIRLENGRTAVRETVQSIERCAPDFDRERQRVDEQTRGATLRVEEVRRNAAQEVGGCVWRLKSLDPFATLERGYAIVQRATAVVSEVAAAKPGEALKVRVRDGTFGVRVDGGTPVKQRRRPRVSDAQAPLFAMPEERA